MHTWLEISRNLLVAIPVSLLLVALALFLYDGLRYLVRGILSWLDAQTARSAEEEAVDAIAKYQGAFHLDKPNAVRQRFARKYEIKFRNHWGCEGKWVRKWELDE